MPSFEEQAKDAFPGDICCISLTTTTTSALDNNKTSDGLCTAAFLQAIENQTNPSWKDVMQSMRQYLDSASADQEAVLQSSRQININKQPFNIVPPKTDGNKRAVLIGINYTGQPNSLKMSHDSVLRIKDYLIDKQGFDLNQITVLMDMKGHLYYPTRKNIRTSFRKVVRESNANDIIFVYFAGRSGRILDTTDKAGKQRYVETLLPIDFEKEGAIIADEINETLLCAANVARMTLVMDCCGGSIIQLPYIYNAGDTNALQMYQTDGFDFSALIGLAIVGGILVAAGSSSGGDDGGNALAGGDTGGNTSATSSDTGDDCCGSCCEGLFEGLFEG